MAHLNLRVIFCYFNGDSCFETKKPGLLNPNSVGLYIYLREKYNKARKRLLQRHCWVNLFTFLSEASFLMFLVHKLNYHMCVAAGVNSYYWFSMISFYIRRLQICTCFFAGGYHFSYLLTLIIF